MCEGRGITISLYLFFFSLTFFNPTESAGINYSSRMVNASTYPSIYSYQVSYLQSLQRVLVAAENETYDGSLTRLSPTTFLWKTIGLNGERKQLGGDDYFVTWEPLEGREWEAGGHWRGGKKFHRPVAKVVDNMDGSYIFDFSDLRCGFEGFKEIEIEENEEHQLTEGGQIEEPQYRQFPLYQVQEQHQRLYQQYLQQQQQLHELQHHRQQQQQQHTFQLSVKSFTGRIMTLEVDSSETIESVKQKIKEKEERERGRERDGGEEGEKERKSGGGVMEWSFGSERGEGGEEERGREKEERRNGNGMRGFRRDILSWGEEGGREEGGEGGREWIGKRRFIKREGEREEEEREKEREEERWKERGWVGRNWLKREGEKGEERKDENKEGREEESEWAGKKWLRKREGEKEEEKEREKESKEKREGERKGERRGERDKGQKMEENKEEQKEEKIERKQKQGGDMMGRLRVLLQHTQGMGRKPLMTQRCVRDACAVNRVLYSEEIPFSSFFVPSPPSFSPFSSSPSFRYNIVQRKKLEHGINNKEFIPFLSHFSHVLFAGDSVTIGMFRGIEKMLRGGAKRTSLFPLVPKVPEENPSEEYLKTAVYPKVSLHSYDLRRTFLRYRNSTFENVTKNIAEDVRLMIKKEMGRTNFTEASGGEREGEGIAVVLNTGMWNLLGMDGMASKDPLYSSFITYLEEWIIDLKKHLPKKVKIFYREMTAPQVHEVICPPNTKCPDRVRYLSQGRFKYFASIQHILMKKHGIETFGGYDTSHEGTTEMGDGRHYLQVTYNRLVRSWGTVGGEWVSVTPCFTPHNWDKSIVN